MAYIGVVAAAPVAASSSARALRLIGEAEAGESAMLYTGFVLDGDPLTGDETVTFTLTEAPGAPGHFNGDDVDFPVELIFRAMRRATRKRISASGVTATSATITLRAGHPNPFVWPVWCNQHHTRPGEKSPDGARSRTLTISNPVGATVRAGTLAQRIVNTHPRLDTLAQALDFLGATDIDLLDPASVTLDANGRAAAIKATDGVRKGEVLFEPPAEGRRAGWVAGTGLNLQNAAETVNGTAYARHRYESRRAVHGATVCGRMDKGWLSNAWFLFRWRQRGAEPAGTDQWLFTIGKEGDPSHIAFGFRCSDSNTSAGAALPANQGRMSYFRRPKPDGPTHRAAYAAGRGAEVFPATSATDFHRKPNGVTVVHGVGWRGNQGGRFENNGPVKPSHLDGRDPVRPDDDAAVFAGGSPVEEALNDLAVIGAFNDAGAGSVTPNVTLRGVLVVPGEKLEGNPYAWARLRTLSGARDGLAALPTPAVFNPRTAVLSPALGLVGLQPRFVCTFGEVPMSALPGVGAPPRPGEGFLPANFNPSWGTEVSQSYQTMTNYNAGAGGATSSAFPDSRHPKVWREAKLRLLLRDPDHGELGGMLIGLKAALSDAEKEVASYDPGYGRIGPLPHLATYVTTRRLYWEQHRVGLRSRYVRPQRQRLGFFSADWTLPISGTHPWEIDDFEDLEADAITGGSNLHGKAVYGAEGSDGYDEYGRTQYLDSQGRPKQVRVLMQGLGTRFNLIETLLTDTEIVVLYDRWEINRGDRVAGFNAIGCGLSNQEGWRRNGPRVNRTYGATATPVSQPTVYRTMRSWLCYDQPLPAPALGTGTDADANAILAALSVTLSPARQAAVQDWVKVSKAITLFHHGGGAHPRLSVWQVMAWFTMTLGLPAADSTLNWRNPAGPRATRSVAVAPDANHDPALGFLASGDAAFAFDTGLAPGTLAANANATGTPLGASNPGPFNTPVLRRHGVLFDFVGSPQPGSVAYQANAAHWLEMALTQARHSHNPLIYAGEEVWRCRSGQTNADVVGLCEPTGRQGLFVAYHGPGGAADDVGSSTVDGVYLAREDWIGTTGAPGGASPFDASTLRFGKAAGLRWRAYGYLPLMSPEEHEAWVEHGYAPLRAAMAGA